ncbi:MAG TPA: glycosyltransferase, partial [Candidatus Saccharimonadales bacterium]|nr:glycosyltransferase [Candidatus Saccharimonadales bacterium]
VLPSTWPETFGKVGVEAMSVGRPVVATDVGGVRDWLYDGKNGFLVEPNHPEQIAEKIITILSSKTKIQKMSKEAAKTSQDFAIENMAFNIEKLIKSYRK